MRTPRLIAAGLAVATGLLAAGSAAADTLKLVALNFPPLIFEENGAPTGIAFDLVTEALRRAGHQASVEVMPWARALDMTRDGQADAIFTAYRTPEREQFLNYSNEVVVPQVVSLFVRADSPVAFAGDLAALAPYRVGVVNQISYGKAIDDAIKDGVLANVEKSNDSDSNVKKLVAGRFDVMPSNRYVARHILKAQGVTDQVKELTPEVQNIPSYIAFTKARDTAALRDAFDAALAAMKADGTVQTIMDKYTR
ncbi:substrate-binding periplasmic protein [Azospirillum sp. ST 5-10]|uniref:substrate-binding periplasmic protein n=1 Tax=unclassified Azospirillum TaxID=2630922 RepID=UPI003F4A4DC0